MTLNEFLNQNELITNIPKELIKLTSEHECKLMDTVLDEWYENFFDDRSFNTPDAMFAAYTAKSEREHPSLQNMMEEWWKNRQYGKKTNGELLNEALLSYAKEYKSEAPLKTIPSFTKEQFCKLFEDIFFIKPSLDFYNFFNPHLHNSIRCPSLPRAKHFPLFFSKNSIVKRFSKNNYFIEISVWNTLSNFYEAYRFNNKTWHEYIIETVINKICETNQGEKNETE